MPDARISALNTPHDHTAEGHAKTLFVLFSKLPFSHEIRIVFLGAGRRDRGRSRIPNTEERLAAQRELHALVTQRGDDSRRAVHVRGGNVVDEREHGDEGELEFRRASVGHFPRSVGKGGAQFLNAGAAHREPDAHIG